MGTPGRGTIMAGRKPDTEVHHPLPFWVLLISGICLNVILSVGVQSDPIWSSRPLSWDGIDRLDTSGDLVDLASSRQVVLEVSLPSETEDDTRARIVALAQVVAQSLAHFDVVVAITDQQEWADSDWQGVPSEALIRVHRSGVAVPYYGLHSHDALVGFMHNVLRDLITLIEGKVHKKAFDKLEHYKLVGYFDVDTDELQVFKEAASHLHPYVSCHVVQESKVAQKLKLKTKNAIHFYRPYDSKPSKLAPASADKASILDFVQENWNCPLDPMSPQDMYAPWHHPLAGATVLVFMRPQTPEDYAFFKAIKTIAKDNRGNKNLHMLLINPDQFMELLPQWGHLYDVDLRYAAMGIMDQTEGSSVWFNATDIVTPICTECVTQQITAWLEDNLPGFTYGGEDSEEKSGGKEEQEENKVPDDTENSSVGPQEGDEPAENGTYSLESTRLCKGWVNSLLLDCPDSQDSSSFILGGVSAGKLHGQPPKEPSEEH